MEEAVKLLLLALFIYCDASAQDKQYLYNFSIVTLVKVKI